MKKVAALMAAVVGVAGGALADPPSESFTVDYRVRDPQFAIQAKRATTPRWVFNLYDGTNAWTATGWTCLLRYYKSLDSAAMCTVTGTVSGATVTFDATTNVLGETIKGGYAALTASSNTYLVTFAIGGIDVEKSPEVGAQNALRATVAINGADYGPFIGDFSGWPFLLSAGTNSVNYATWAGNATNANNAALLGGRSEVTISNAFDVAWTAKDTSLSNAVWGTFWTLAQQTTFSNWTAATYLPLHGTADNSAALGGRNEATISNTFALAWAQLDASLSNAVWGVFWTAANQTTFSNYLSATYWTQAAQGIYSNYVASTFPTNAGAGGTGTYVMTNGGWGLLTFDTTTPLLYLTNGSDLARSLPWCTVSNSTLHGGLSVAGVSNAILNRTFGGSGTTGTVYSAAGDAGKYLLADGTWGTPTSAGFVVTNLDTTSGNVTFTLPAPGTSFYVLSKTNSANWLYVVYGTTTSSVAGTASVKAYPDVILSLWRVEY